MERQQFISLVEGSQKAFRRFLAALCCGDLQLADDIAQESYLKAFVSYGSLKNPDRFKSWIFRIGYTTFIDCKRSQCSYSDYKAAEDMEAGEKADAPFEYQALYAALDRIPAKERTSILLFYMEGYSIKEIAEIEETSQEAVKQHLSRGRSHLRGILSN